MNIIESKPPIDKRIVKGHCSPAKNKNELFLFDTSSIQSFTPDELDEEEAIDFRLLTQNRKFGEKARNEMYSHTFTGQILASH